MLVGMAKEIERKWVVTTVPGDDVLGRGSPIRQGYLAREGDVEARLRITPGEAPQLTIKAGSGMRRTEVEVEVASEDAEALWPHTSGRRLEKVRYRIAMPGTALVAELDVYGGDLSGLSTVEVEFPSEEDAMAFEPPAWFGQEVTGDPAWSNASLVDRGTP